jgi:hypothetical protein
LKIFYLIYSALRIRPGCDFETPLIFPPSENRNSDFEIGSPTGSPFVFLRYLHLSTFSASSTGATEWSDLTPCGTQDWPLMKSWKSTYALSMTRGSRAYEICI